MKFIKVVLVSVALFFLAINCFSKEVNKENARKLALNFYSEKSGINISYLNFGDEFSISNGLYPGTGKAALSAEIIINPSFMLKI